jgi:hypothetical protein
MPPDFRTPSIPRSTQQWETPLPGLGSSTPIVVGASLVPLHDGRVLMRTAKYLRAFVKK